MEKRKGSYRPHVICLRLTEEENKKLRKIISMNNDRGHSISRSEYIRERIFAPDRGTVILQAKDEMKKLRVEIHFLAKEMKRDHKEQESALMISRCENALSDISRRLEEENGSNSS